MLQKTVINKKMIFFDKLTDFVFDERKKISSKAAIIILALLGILLIDNIVGFSYSYLLDNKIEEVQKLNDIITNKSSDNFTINQAIKLRVEILNRKNVIEKINNYLVNVSNNESFTKTKIEKAQELNIDKNAPNQFWFHFTSGGIYYFLAIIMFPLMLFVEKSSTLIQRITMSILLIAMFSGIGLFFFWLCSLIPIILQDTWILNYAINIIIQGLFIYLISKFNKI